MNTPEQIAELKRQLAEAEAACAEMRITLQAVYDEMSSIETRKLAIDALHSSECGIGWLSPEVREKVREAVQRIESKCNEPPDCDKVADIWDMTKQALALLDGKERK